MNGFRKHCSMNSKRVLSRLLVSSFGVAMNENPTLYYVNGVDALLIVGIISAIYVTIAPINDSEARINKIIHELNVDMKSKIRDSEATIRDTIKHSEARTNNIIKEMKVEMRESESTMRNNFKSDMKASELRIIQKIDVNSEKKVMP